MGATAYIKAIMDVYGNTFTSLGPKEDPRACLVGYLGCYLYDLLYVFDTLDLSKSYNDFSFQKVHLFEKTTTHINTAEKEHAQWVGSDGWPSLHYIFGCEA